MKKYLKLFIILFCLPNFASSQVLEQQKYVYNNSKDTIIFNKFKLNYTKIGNNPWFGNCSEPKIVDSIQIDGVGRKEIVFYLFCSFSNSQHGGSFDISESKEIGKYEIWNLDTKILLFEAINYVKDEFDRFHAGIENSKGCGFYKYDLNIDNLGLIIIKYPKGKYISQNKRKEKKRKKKTTEKAPCFSLKPDKEEGIYRFINGEYLKE